jgi:hypothetical protein
MKRADLIGLIRTYVGPSAPNGTKGPELMAHILKRTGLDSPAAERLWERDRAAFCAELRERSARIGELLAHRSPQRTLDPYTD